ncbi:MAG: efflux RND transporter periplasmic adaptor subunit [Pseudomonadales bacterium]
MLIVLSLYFVVVWLVFGKFKWLPWNRLWKTVVYSIAGLVALVVVGALQFYTPVSKMAVVQNNTQLIYPLVGGQVKSVGVTESQQVKAGDILFQLDPKPFQYAVDQRLAALKLAEIRLRDTKTLVEKQAAPRSNIDLYTSELNQAQALYDEAVYQLDNSVIQAPVSGVISMATLQVGEVVAANTPILSLIQTGEPRIAAAFKQNGLGLIKAGVRATVLFSADPGTIYETTVFRVAPESIQGQVTVKNVASPIDAIASSTGMYPVWVAFPEDAPADLRRSGMEASVTVFTSEGNPINALANILQILSSWMAFIF